MLQRPARSIRRNAATTAITKGAFQRRPPWRTAGGMYQSGSAGAELGQVDADRHRPSAIGCVGVGGQGQGRQLLVAREFPGVPVLVGHTGQASGRVTGGPTAPSPEVMSMVEEESGTSRSVMPGPQGEDGAGSTPKNPGWYPTRTNPNDQTYWDGQDWTARRRWTSGKGWVVVGDAPAGRTVIRGRRRSTLGCPPTPTPPSRWPGPRGPASRSTSASCCSGSAGSP